MKSRFFYILCFFVLPTLIQAQFNNALHFDGFNDYIAITNAPNVQNLSGSFVIET